MERYTFVARVLHWLIAACILINICLGLFWNYTEEPPIRIMGLHKSFGLTILALSIARIGWRFTHKPPALPAAMPQWERAAAHVTHWAFYGLLFVMPVTGWLYVSAGPVPLTYFDLFGLPKLPVEKGDFLADIASPTHVFLAWTMVVLLILHVGAALRHHFIIKDDVFKRMFF